MNNFKLTSLPSLFEACDVWEERKSREQEFSLYKENGDEYTIDELFYFGICTNWNAVIEGMLAQETIEYVKFFVLNLCLECPYLEDHLCDSYNSIIDKWSKTSLEYEREKLERKRKWKKESLKLEIKRIRERWKNEAS